MSAFSFSKAALAKHCLYPFRDDVTSPPRELVIEGQETGIDCHAAGAKLINGKLEVDIKGLEDDLTWGHMQRWIRENYRPGWLAEVALAWDPVTDSARVLGVDIGREYEAHGLGPSEVAGTCDVVDARPGVVSVYEFGTGYDVEHKLEQLKLQCLAAARAYGATKVVGQLIQFREDGARPWPPIIIDEFDLASAAGDFSERFAQRENAQPVVGDACVDLFCDQRSECPATVEAQAALVPEGALARKFSRDITDPEHARWMLERVRLVMAACKDVKEAINAYVPEGGIKLEDGKFIYEGAREMARFDNHKALALLKQLGATDAQISSLTRPVIEGAGLKVGSEKAAAAAKAKRAGRAA